MMRKKKLKTEKDDGKYLEVERLINEELTEMETGQSSDEEEIRKRLIPLLTKVLHGKKVPVLPEETRKYIEEAKKKYPELMEA